MTPEALPQMAVTDLKPCPFCGRHVELADVPTASAPIMHHPPYDLYCPIAGRFFLVSAWNTRLQALAEPATGGGVLRETHWLLERRCSPPLYLRTKYDLGSQTDDVDHAARFATKREAQEALRIMPSPPHERAEFFASEHMWIDSSPVALSTTASNPPAPSAFMVGACKHERLGAMTATGYMSCVDCRWMRPMTPEEFARWNPPFEARSK